MPPLSPVPGRALGASLRGAAGSKFLALLGGGRPLSRVARRAFRALLLSSVGLWICSGCSKSLPPVSGVAYSGDTILSVAGGYLSIWDAHTGAKRGHFQYRSSWYWKTCAFAVSPDGAFAATGSDDGEVRLIDLKSQTSARMPGGHSHPSMILGLAFSPDGEYLLSVAEDATVRLWHTKTRTAEYAFFSEEWWDIKQSAPAFVNFGGPLPRAVAFSNDGQRIAIGDGKGGEVSIWQLDKIVSGEYVRRAPPHDGTLRRMKDGDQAEVRLAAPPDSPLKYGVSYLAFALKDQVLVEANEQGMITWDWKHGKAVGSYKGEMGYFSRQFAVAHDSAWIATGAVMSLHPRATLRNFETQETHEFSGITDKGASFAFSPDDMEVVSGGDDGSVWIWSVATGGLKQKLTGP